MFIKLEIIAKITYLFKDQKSYEINVKNQYS
jgi:hypothetical protein